MSGTRWSEACGCYERERELTQWDALTLYFTNEVFESANPEAGEILTILQNKTIRAFTMFLKYNLNDFNQFNASYQTRDLMIHRMWRDIESFMLKIGSRCIVPRSVPLITTNQFNIKENLIQLNDIDVGNECREYLATLTPQDQSFVRQGAMRFYVEAMQGMRNRLLTKKDFLDRLIFVEPEMALAVDRNLDRILYLREHHFPSIDAAELTRVDDSGKIVVELKEGERLVFPNLKELTEAISSIPHFNAEPEQDFSVVTELTSNKGNRTGLYLLDARCSLRFFNRQYPENTAFNFEPKRGNFDRFNQRMYERQDGLINERNGLIDGQDERIDE
ncbi:hypothetical protein QAD02_013856 [Eretmocerus hayati]|uniref:Uncharacterized protein n=1 Tax=Eretmocerus hayati TaxID=131215 RepID=A0ACC2P3B2_9HYME|nr:hypothetical protein QAD02_013856 [Eretmocerus hayati]